MPIKIKELKQLIKREKKAIKLLNKFYKIDWWFATYGNGVPALCEAYQAFKQEQATSKSEDAKTRFVANHSPYRVRRIVK